MAGCDQAPSGNDPQEGYRWLGPPAREVLAEHHTRAANVRAELRFGLHRQFRNSVL